MSIFIIIGKRALFPPPTSHELPFFSVTSAFTRLSMKTKYVYRGLISMYVNMSVHNNPTKWSFTCKNLQVGGGEREREREREETEPENGSISFT